MLLDLKFAAVPEEMDVLQRPMRPECERRDDFSNREAVLADLPSNYRSRRELVDLEHKALRPEVICSVYSDLAAHG